ncbi:hypothetical protein MASR2M29_02260 [Spirochaetota bacterium]
MELNLVDPYDRNLTYNPYDTVVVAFADPDIRAEVIDYYSHLAHVFDIYRDAELLLPMLVKIECFFRILDSDSYFAVEDQIIELLDSVEETSPFVIYDIGQNILFENPYIINGDKTLPEMVNCFFAHCRRQRR